MKTFLRNVLLFSCLVFVYLTFVFAFNFYNENHPRIPKANILFLGDSHIKYQVNPDSFINAYNYGLSGDVLIGLKWKLEKILNSNNSIDTIIISLGYHNFREFYPSFFDINVHDAAAQNISRYLFINDWYFLKTTRLDKMLVTEKIFDKIKKPLREISYLGYFIEQNGQMNDSSNSSISRLYTTNKRFNYEIIKTIEQLIEFCNSKNVKCFFIFPPTHQTYLKRVPADIKVHTDRFMNQFSKTSYFIPIEIALDDSLFFDGDHLNSAGAKIYTHSLKHALYNKKKRQKTDL
jgi:hypothetical protein